MTQAAAQDPAPGGPAPGGPAPGDPAPGGGGGGDRPPSALFRFFFVDRTLAGLLGVLIILSGLLAYGSMVKEASPDLAIPMAMVRAQWPGAAPDLVEKEVTDVLEKGINSLDNLKSLSSGSRSGSVTILVEFTADAPVDESIRALRTKVGELAGSLPDAVSSPSVEQMSTTDTPVLTYMLYGDVPDGLLGDAARDLKDRLEGIGDVRKVTISGARDDIVRVLVDPLRLNALDLPLATVRDALAGASLDQPLGALQGGPLAADITLAGRFSTLAELEALPVKETAGGHIVRLGDIADIQKTLSTPSDRTFVSLGGAPFAKGVSITLYKAPGSDTLKVVEAARSLVEATPLPPGLNTRIVSNEAVDVSNKLSSVFLNAAEAVAAVIAVLLLALSWREAIMAGVAVPITFLGAVAVVFALGMTMNQMVVIGMVLALGMLVDVFILVMEGMHQAMIGERRPFPEAARATVRRYALPAFAGQLTTILALAPLLFLGGVSGKFIQLVPTTAIVCLVISYAVAFVWMLPMSRALLGHAPKAGGTSVADLVTRKASGGLSGFLQALVVRNRLTAALWLAGVAGLVVLALMAAAALPSEMYPKEDGRNMGVTVTLPPGTPLETSAEAGKAIGAVLRDKDYIESVILYAGRNSPYSLSAPTEQIADTPGSHVIGYSVTFVPLAERGGRLAYTYVPELRQALQAQLAGRPGASLILSPQTGGPSGGDDIQFEIRGEALDSLRAAAEDLRALIASLPHTADVRDDLGAPGLVVNVVPNRAALEFFGIPLSRFAEDMALALKGSAVASLKRGATEDDLPVRLDLAWPSRDGEAGPPRTIQELSLVRLSTGEGSSVEANALFNYDPGSRPQLVLRNDGVRTVTVRAKADGVNPNPIIGAVMDRLPDLEARHPGLSFGLAGSAKEAGETGQQMMMLFLVTLVLMFSVLVILFNSYSLPFIILLAVPCALVGTFGGFFLISMPISFPAMVGIVSLLGIVVNVSIVMVETMRDHVRRGRSAREAAANGAAERLRPIVSTGLTTIAGLVLLSMSSPMWQPLCYAIIFGLIAATVLSLVVIPALFLIISPRAVRERPDGHTEGSADLPAPAAPTEA